MKFIITVDTEADNQWKEGGEISLKNIQFLPRFQTLCEKYGFIPTYLVTYEVAEDSASAMLLSNWQSKGLAEVGAHLHPWTNPPMVPYESGKHMYPSTLADADFKSKLATLTSIIKEKFGHSPVSYRAGRWGFKESHGSVLRELGYIADCSITPKTNWGEVKDKLSGEYGPDFRKYSVYPFYIAEGLLEIPMTIVYTGILSQESGLGKWFSRLSENIIKKVLNKLFFQKKWLRIFPESNPKDWKKIYQSAKKNNLPVMEFMIHSSELMAGGSPYSKTAESVERIYKNLEVMFEYFKSQGVEGVSMKEFVSSFK